MDEQQTKTVTTKNNWTKSWKVKRKQRMFPYLYIFD